MPPPRLAQCVTKIMPVTTQTPCAYLSLAPVSDRLQPQFGYTFLQMYSSF